MKLNDFLSTMLLPESGSRRGVHWHAGTNTNMSPAMDAELDTIARVTAGGFLKVVSDGTGGQADLMQQARARGLIPICRIFQGPTGRPTDGHARFLEWIAKNIGRPGKRIVVEIFNECDLGAEWPGQPPVPPHNWLEITVENWLRFYPVCINAGVLPAFPATASGVFNPARPAGYWDPATNPYLWLKQAGVTDFVDTVHPYGSNHTEADYPYDPINQAGVPITDAEWAFPGVWRWPGDTIPDWLRDRLIHFAWDGRRRVDIDAQRLRDRNPGKGIDQDDTAWLASIVKRKLLCEAGYDYVPILSTEDGPVHGISEDGRYPRNVAATMIRAIAWRLHFMHAFPWLLGTNFWLWGQEMLSGGTGGWQQDAWRTHRHDEFYATPGLGLQPVAVWLMNRPVECDPLGFVEGEGLGLRRPDWSPVVAFLGEEPASPLPTPGPEPIPEPPDASPDDPTEEEADVEWDIPSWNEAKLVPAPAAPGEHYWRVVRAHYRTPAENAGGHHLYVTVLDEAGRRIPGAMVVVRNVNGQTETMIQDKPVNEPGCNRPFYRDDRIEVWVTGTPQESGTGGWKSDWVTDLHTDYPDDLTPGEYPGNSRYHRSIDLVFQAAVKADTPPPDQPPSETQPGPEPGDTWLTVWAEGTYRLQKRTG